MLLHHGEVRGHLAPADLQLVEVESPGVGVLQVAGVLRHRRPESGHGLHLHGEILEEMKRVELLPSWS